MTPIPLAQAKALGYKAQDSWWTVFLVDPVAIRLVRYATRFRWITPNRLTISAFVVGLLAAASFALAASSPKWLILGALVFHVSFIIDCMDGKLARIQGTGSFFGEWLDYILDRVRVLLCAAALAGGQFVATGESAYLFLGIGVVFLDMFRYLNALQIHKMRADMRARLESSRSDAIAADAGPRSYDLQQGFNSRFQFLTVASKRLAQSRVRPHLVSGIEFQMAVFIVGPLTMAVIAVSAVAGALFLLFEIGIIYKLWLSTRDFSRQIAAMRQASTGSR